MGLKRGSIYRIIFILVFSSPIFIGASKQSVKTKSAFLVKKMAVFHSVLNKNLLNQKRLMFEMEDILSEFREAQNMLTLVNSKDEIKSAESIALKVQFEHLEKEKERAIKQYQIIILEEYKHRDYKNKLYFLASSESIKGLINRIKYLNKLKELRKKQLKGIEGKRKKIEDKITVYNGSYQSKADLTFEKLALISNLNEKLRLCKMKLNVLKNEQNELELLMLQKNKVIKSEEELYKIRPDVIHENDLIWPIEQGVITKHFGVDNHHEEHGILIENNGIDILTRAKEPVFAILSGKVKAVIGAPNLEKALIIEHAKYLSFYRNIRITGLEVGDSVLRGERIGSVARNRESQFLLHFELWNGRKKLNPEEHLIGSEE